MAIVAVIKSYRTKSGKYVRSFRRKVGRGFKRNRAFRVGLTKR